MKETQTRENRIKRWLCAFIPRFVGNGAIVFAYEVMRFFGRLFVGALRRKNLNFEANSRAFERHRAQIENAQGYIEDQHNYTDMFYGVTKMQATGCEVIATYNALKSLLGEERFSLAELIGSFERDGISLSGRAGSAPKAIRSFFARNGFETAFTIKEAKAKELAEAYDSLILTMYNDKRNILQQIHTVHISKQPEGYFAHNARADGRPDGPYTDFAELLAGINNGQAKMISLIGLRQKDRF